MATFAAVVTSIASTETETIVGFKGRDGGYVLQYDHAGYSSIYTMLMTSAVNKGAINVNANPDATGNQIIQSAELTF